MKTQQFKNKVLMSYFFSIVLFSNSISAQELVTSGALRLNEVNIHAARYFNKKFPDIIEQSWYSTSIGNQVVFKENGISRQSIFNQRGEFEYTIKFIEAKDLPQNILKRIALNFPRFEVHSVSEIQFSENCMYFIVIIQSNTQKSFVISEEEIQLHSSVLLSEK